MATAESSGPLVYPYSVIPGGVHSGSDLQHALQGDAVAAAHYADFDLASVRAMRLRTSRNVYLSYRVGDRIYWTRKRIMLPQGETLLSDGTHLVRTRCGNRISDTPGPSSPDEPTEEVFDHPLRPNVPAWVPADLPPGALVPYDPETFLLTLNSPLTPPSPGVPGNGYTPILPPIFCCGGSTPSGSRPPAPTPPVPPIPPPTPPIATPEPSSLLLITLGSFTLLCLRAFRRS